MNVLKKLERTIIKAFVILGRGLSPQSFGDFIFSGVYYRQIERQKHTYNTCKMASFLSCLQKISALKNLKLQNERGGGWKSKFTFHYNKRGTFVRFIASNENNFPFFFLEK